MSSSIDGAIRAGLAHDGATATLTAHVAPRTLLATDVATATPTANETARFGLTDERTIPPLAVLRAPRTGLTRGFAPWLHAVLLTDGLIGALHSAAGRVTVGSAGGPGSATTFTRPF